MLRTKDLVTSLTLTQDSEDVDRQDMPLNSETDTVGDPSIWKYQIIGDKAGTCKIKANSVFAGLTGRRFPLT